MRSNVLNIIILSMIVAVAVFICYLPAYYYSLSIFGKRSIDQKSYNRHHDGARYKRKNIIIFSFLMVYAQMRAAQHINCARNSKKNQTQTKNNENSWTRSISKRARVTIFWVCWFLRKNSSCRKATKNKWRPDGKKGEQKNNVYIYMQCTQMYCVECNVDTVT